MWYYSGDGEIYRSASFATKEAAIDAGGKEYCGDKLYWVGVGVPPPPPESYCSNVWDDVVRAASDDEVNYGGEWAEGWGYSTLAQERELDLAVSRVIGDWLDRHNLRPKFVNIDSASVRMCCNGRQVNPDKEATL
jgi:hypothetical protein